MELLTVVGWGPKIFNTAMSWLGRPRPVFEFEYRLATTNENPYCHCRIITGSNGILGWFIRLGVRNRGSVPILNADVRVEKIETIDANGNVSSFSSTPFFLHWANDNTDNSRHLYSDTPVYIDLVHTTQGNKGAIVFAKGNHVQTGIPMNLPPNNYLLHLRLLSPNIQPINQIVSVEVNGKWDAIKVGLVK